MEIILKIVIGNLSTLNYITSLLLWQDLMKDVFDIIIMQSRLESMVNLKPFTFILSREERSVTREKPPAPGHLN